MRVNIISITGNLVFGNNEVPDPKNKDNLAKKFPFPPLASAKLTAYLKSRGFDARQEDLSLQIVNDNYFEKSRLKKVDVRLFNDHERVAGFLHGKNDFHLREMTRRLINKIKSKDADVMAFSVFYSTGLDIALCIMKQIREQNEGIKFIIGGIDCEYNNYLTLLDKTNLVDFIVFGEGEIPFSLLCSALEKGDGFSRVPNIYYRKNGKLTRSKESAEPLNLDDAPAPDFDDLPLGLYKKISKPYDVLVLPYQFIKGCTFKCLFCRFYLHSYLKSMNYNKIVADLSLLQQKYKTNCFMFLNNTLNISNEFVDGLCNSFKKEKTDFLWSDSVRPIGINGNTLNKMKSSGCIRLSWGVESGSDSLLQRMCKGSTTESIAKSLGHSSKAGIWNTVNFMVGYPYETEEDVLATRKFIASNKGSIHEVLLSIFRLTDSILLKQPGRFRIRVGNLVSNEFYSFDETEGLVWGEKSKQAEERFKGIQSLLKSKGIPEKVSCQPIYFSYIKRNINQLNFHFHLV